MLSIEAQSGEAKSILKELKANTDYHAFSIHGETSRCNTIIAKGEHVFVGISPFNSRFSKEYIRAIIEWAQINFLQVDILLPSTEEASRLLVATGYSTEKAKKKTARELRRLNKYVEEALSRSLIFEGIRVIDFSHYLLVPEYIELKDNVEKAFEEDSCFRESCLQMSRQALLGRLKGVGKGEQDLSEKDINIALPYIFAELPFYLDTPRILNVSSSTLVYHRPWPIGKGLYAGEFNLKVGRFQSYGVIKPIHTF
ncbi:tRNA-dependent cyclodipeptide synthase [Marinomonas mediterranea]|jgi:hypothetical protein|uniref:Cyclodipeptide synthase n=1 Tax=Marinomonas mediterranea (strain ATCC 700492 / JCM 21426 / NBRC 103028 / MMB-1) TaxID=717774 RepID=F2JX60_MARM1|nr:tRNA-dependent cyclodipeptide synthase [Marinomonas mediterranea]ADZ89579.1 hypothetical protein Marme_0276 [Marinomonas mediterranea MMB-1]WCN11773.1 tRNA-dependent cyclodipeptide synthase [Marinomonas mediterranea]WCN15821.1 tRNA-dependent cyclodipeptide synthase [Marinomonas mediterranea MMB-1]